MGPDDFRRRPANTNQPRPAQNSSDQAKPRPMMDGFAPTHRRTPQPGASPQRPLQHVQQQRPTAKTQTDLKQQADDFKKQKKTHRNSKLKKWLLIAGIPLLLLAGIVVFVAVKGDSKKPTTQTQAKPLVPPEFTIYYPNPLPDGLNTTKNSINYSKGSFSFILQQNGQNHFFVNEQPASVDPDFSVLKGQITAPTSITTTLGQGITGTVDGGTITAAKTDKNTLITVNCVKITCEPLSEQILSNMQVNDNVDSLRRSNL
jgi:hypothetical protein